ncbi:MAG TPA: hypothetical protein IGS17_04800 [Oscillatoriales cyanobacterium M59_W2019_021]|nr:hypothetical protein [Oscillatoriales cyanobacterium M4454_W2019_049]HIK50236.1 hypothetical protein [Oscillatoriales cyanobacterium M59_W2019_021]
MRLFQKGLPPSLNKDDTAYFPTPRATFPSQKHHSHQPSWQTDGWERWRMDAVRDYATPLM